MRCVLYYKCRKSFGNADGVMVMRKDIPLFFYCSMHFDVMVDSWKLKQEIERKKS